MQFSNPITACTCVAALALAAVSPAADWPQWRGPQRDGVVREGSGHPGGWPPVKLWGRQVGPGCTSPIIAGGRLYVMGFSGGRGGSGTDVVYCFDAATGKELWRQSYRSRYQGRLRRGDTGAYGGPSSTPTLDPQTHLLYTLGVDGHLRCWDTKRGGRGVWAMNLHERYRIRRRRSVGGGRRDYGHPGSPLVRGDLLIVEVGSDQGTVMAFDKRTGRQRWASQLKGPGGHTSGPVAMRVQNVDCLANLLIDGLVVMRIDPGREGRTIARHERRTEYACNIAAPAVAGNRVVLTSEYNQANSELLEITLGGARRKWRSRTHALVSTPVVSRGRVFMVGKSLKCLDLATGRQLWRGGNFGHGSCIVTDDEKIIVFGNGKLALVEAFPSRHQYRELARVERLVRGTCYPHVCLSDGLIGCKDRDGRMVVLSVRPGDRRAVAMTLKTDPPKSPAKRQPAPAATPGPAGEADKLHDAPAPKLGTAWPGNTEGAVFVWQTARSANRLKAGRACRVRSRGAAKFDAAGRMDLSKGAMLAEDTDELALSACRQSHQLSIEVRLAPGDLRQNGPARIVSFSEGPYQRNFTLGQERDKLVLRLRTPRTGSNGMNPQTELLRLRGAGKAHHVIVSYSPGRLCCYLDGKRVLDSGRVRGDFNNWSAQHLLFGDEWRETRDWAGTLDHVAIHSRVIGAAEAAARYKLAAKTR